MNNLVHREDVIKIIDKNIVALIEADHKQSASDLITIRKEIHELHIAQSPTAEWNKKHYEN